MAKQVYETRPLACWQRAKELRFQHYRDVWEAKEKGKLLVTGGEYSFLPLPAGLGGYEFLGGEPYAATVGTDRNLAIQCAEATEKRGYPANMCSYMRLYWGCMFLDKSPFGKFIRPDFCLPWHLCESHAKWYQTVAEYYGIPTFPIDLPIRPRGSSTRDAHLKYLINQFHDAIEWMQKITGRGYDDERLIEAVSNEINATALWAQVCELNKNIPAPLDLKSMYSLYVINGLIRHRKEAQEFYRVLLDEVRDRVDKKIAAIREERLRLYHDPEPVWHFLRLFRYLERYGAVCMASHYGFLVGTAFEAAEDGSWVAARTLDQQGITLSTREEALHALAASYIDRPGLMAWYPRNKVEDTLSIMRDWHCDGAILHFNRGCTLTAGAAEVRLALRERGIPAMVYESNMVDPREFDEARVLARVDAFVESQGLRDMGLDLG